MLADDFDLWSQEMHDWFENIAAHYLNLLDRGGVHYHDWYEALVAWYEWQRTHADSGRG